MGRWIHTFLTGRTQRVLVNSSRSNPSEVKSGVPQGSVLGPLIFLVLIGDIDHDIACVFLSSFADDTRIGSHIALVHDTEDLQADLDSVYKWTHENNMDLNASKFECLRYGPNSDLQALASYKSNSGSLIRVKDSVKDLVVTRSADASFRKHIKSVVETANSQCGWILRTFRTRTNYLCFQKL